MASTCFGHLNVHLQELLYTGCYNIRVLIHNPLTPSHVFHRA